MSPIYSKGQRDEQMRYGILAGTLSSLAMDLRLLTQYPASAELMQKSLKRMHKEATDALDAARATFQRKD